MTCIKVTSSSSDSSTHVANLQLEERIKICMYIPLTRQKPGVEALIFLGP